MPSTPKQMRAAGRELRMRRDGKVRQQQIIGRGTRPFGAASTQTLRSYASWPDPDEQRRAARKEKEIRDDRTFLYADRTRAFGKASAEEIDFFISASDEDIRRRNGETE